MNYQIIKGKAVDEKLSATLKGDVLYITLPYSDEKNFIWLDKFLKKNLLQWRIF